MKQTIFISTSSNKEKFSPILKCHGIHAVHILSDLFLSEQTHQNLYSCLDLLMFFKEPTRRFIGPSVIVLLVDLLPQVHFWFEEVSGTSREQVTEVFLELLSVFFRCIVVRQVLRGREELIGKTKVNVPSLILNLKCNLKKTSLHTHTHNKKDVQSTL